MLIQDPAGCCFLGLPSLQELLGQISQLGGITGGIKGTVELFDVKQLFGGELNSCGHRISLQGMA